MTRDRKQGESSSYRRRSHLLIPAWSHRSEDEEETESEALNGGESKEKSE
jgi:hypothetical protein